MTDEGLPETEQELWDYMQKYKDDIFIIVQDPEGLLYLMGENSDGTPVYCTINLVEGEVENHRRYGSKPISELSPDEFKQKYEEWLKRGHIPVRRLSKPEIDYRKITESKDVQ